MVRRVVTGSAKHSSEKDYGGIKKAVNQIPLAYFEPPPQQAKALTNQAKRQSTSLKKIFQVQKIQDQVSSQAQPIQPKAR